MKSLQERSFLTKFGVISAIGLLAFEALVACGGSSKSAEGVPSCNFITIQKLGRHAINVLANTSANGGTIDSVTYSFGDGSKGETEDPGVPAHHTYTGSRTGTVDVVATLNVDFGDGPLRGAPQPECTYPLHLPLVAH